MSAPVGESAVAAMALLLVSAAVGCHNYDFGSRNGPGEIDIYDDLFSVSVIGRDRVVAVGYHGAAYWSEDAGESWHRGRTSTEKLLFSVSMADRRYGWAVGQLGAILRTEDGGRTWRAQSNPERGERTHLFGVHALDRNRAVAVGEWGGRIQTRDGGETWIDASFTVGPEHPQFVWLSPDEQEKVRAGGVVYEDVNLQDVFCLREQCWLVGEFGTIFRSGDRGETWARSEIVGEVRMDPIRLDFDQIELDPTDVARLAAFAKRLESETHLNVLIDPFVSDREIEAHYASGDPQDLFAIISARLDGAREILGRAGLATDRIRTYNEPPWDYADFAAHDAAFVRRYVEGRRAAQPMLDVSVIQNPLLFTVRFANQSDGLIAGLGGVILRSVDGGRTWRYAPTGRREALFSVAASDARSVAVGEKGVVQYSEDGGRRWAPPGESRFPPVFSFMRDLRFAPDDARVGFIVGGEGMVLRSRDGGDSWIRVLPPRDARAG